MDNGVERNRALAYIRVSTSRQVDEGNGLGSQTARVKEYAKFRGLNLKSRDIVIDDGCTVKNGKGENWLGDQRL